MSTFGVYAVEEILARGASGTVYRARHPELGRTVAIKELTAEVRTAPGRVQALRREAAVLAGLEHPNVVRVLEFVADDERAWLVEEFVDGPSLQTVLDAHGSLTPQQSLGVLRGALTGLAYVHDHGVVHGDIAPRNVLFDHAGTARLVDFGLAVPTGVAGSAGTSYGTPAFISPEATRGEPLTPGSDVYSAGAVLYTLLSGGPPFRAGSVAAVLLAHRDEPAPRFTEHGPHVADLLEHALAKDPADRPADAAALLAELEEAATRTYGAGWLAGAGVAGLVGGLGAGALGAGAVGTGATAASVGATSVHVSAGAAASEAAASTVAAPVHAVAAAAAAEAAQAGTGSARRPQRIRPRTGALVAAGTTVLVAAAAAVVVLLVDGDDDPPVQPAAQTTASPSADASASAAAASSASASAAQAELEARLPEGTYAVSAVVTDSTLPYFPVGGTLAVQWTLARSCTAEECTGTFTSDGGAVYSGLTFDGQVARVTGTGAFFCVGPDGAAVPGTERPTSDALTVEITVPPAPAGGATPTSGPLVLTGTLDRVATLPPDQVPAECADSYRTGGTAHQELTLTWLAPPPPAPGTATATTAAPTTS